MKKNLLLLGMIVCGVTTYSQNVGIDINTPVRKLHIHNGASVFSGLMLSTDATGATANDGIHFGIQYQADQVGNRYGYLLVKENVPLFIGTNDNSSMLRLLPTGQFGVGVTSPEEMFEVNGNIRLRGSGSLNQRLIFRTNANTSDMGSIGQLNDSVISVAYNTGGSQFSRFYFDVKNAKIGIGAIPNATDGKILVYYNSTTGNPHLTLREAGSTDYARLEFGTSTFSRVWHIAGRTTTGTGTTGRENDLLNFWNSGWGDIMSIRGDGRVGIRTTAPATGYALSVNGKIICEELKVQLSGSWPDYVFEDTYPLTPIDQLQKQVMSQKHLPGIPAAAQVESSKGFEMGEMQKKLLEKVEELYRYTFELNDKNAKLEAKIAALEAEIKNQKQ